MRRNIFIATILGFALILGGMGYFMYQNGELKAENEHLKNHLSNTKNGQMDVYMA